MLADRTRLIWLAAGLVLGSGWISIRHMARVGFVMNLGGAIILTLLSWALARFVA